MVFLGLWCLSVLVLLRKPCQVCGPTVLDAILKVREALYLLVVHDRCEEVGDEVVLVVFDRREARSKHSFRSVTAARLATNFP